MNYVVQSVTVFLIAAAFLRNTSACKCMNRHPQEKICSSDYAIKVRLVNVIYQVDAVNDVYTAVILERYKTGAAMVNIVKHANQKIKIWTNNSTAACGVMLEPHSDYVLGGSVTNGQIWIMSCDYIEKADDLIDRAIELLRFDFNNCCDCQLNRCPYDDVTGKLDCSKANATTNGCIWDQNAYNQRECGVCKRRRHRGPCLWDISCVPTHIKGEQSPWHSHEQHDKSDSSSEELSKKKKHYH